MENANHSTNTPTIFSDFKNTNTSCNRFENNIAGCAGTIILFFGMNGWNGFGKFDKSEHMAGVFDD
jgi:hypothetical protein